MANYSELIATINEQIKANGNQEITGPVLNAVLRAMVSALGEGYQFMGVATPDTNPGTPDGNVFYIASKDGIYSNFGGFILKKEVVIITNKNGNWQKIQTGIANSLKVDDLENSKQDKLTFDSTPTLESNNPVTSNGIREALDVQKNEVDEAKEEAIKEINENEQNAILNFNSQRVTPEMLSESTLQLIEASGGGNITNLPDDEDLTSIINELGVQVLKLKDRDYNQINFSGKGYKIIRKNIIGEKNIITQSMIQNDNTIYVIRYDFDLNGETIKVPNNSVIYFYGGSFSNGTLNINSAEIVSYSRCFYNVKAYDVNQIEFNIKWFGFSEDNTPQGNTDIFNYLIDEISPLQGKGLIIHIPSGNYKMNGVNSSTDISIELRGDGKNKTYLWLDENDEDSLFLMRLTCSYSHFSDITFRGNTYNWEKGKVWSNPNKKLIALFSILGFSCIVDRCDFKGSSQHGVYLSGVNYIVFNDCSFLYNLGFGAFNIFVKGVEYNTPWFELNYMGGIIHSIPYKNTRFSPNNIVKVSGGIAENNGIYGIKGAVKNYIGEDFEYQNEFICLDNTISDFIDYRLIYNTSPLSKGLVIKPCKRKKTTLSEDTTLEFVDNQWNDFIVYERNGTFGITFDKNFIAGDTIYLYDYQQDVKNSLEWESEIYQEDVSSDSLNCIIIGGYNSILTIDQNLKKNYYTIGVPSTQSYQEKKLIVNNSVFSGNSISNYVKTTLDSSLIDEKNPVINGLKVCKVTVYNPLLSLSALKDKTDLYLYVCGRYIGNATFKIFDRTDGLVTISKEALCLNGDFTIEYHLGDATNITSIQINLTGRNSELIGYAFIISEKRWPKLEDEESKSSGKFANKPILPPIGFQYFCTDKKTTEGNSNGIIICHKGNNVWVDSLGRIVS